MKQFKANLPDLPTHIGNPALPKHSNREPTWLVLAVSILPSVLPVLVERIGHEISTYFKRKRIKKSKKKKEKKKKNTEGKQEGEEVLEMTEDEFLAHLESGRIRIVSNDGEPIDFDDNEGEDDAEASDEEE
jgi:hypothetical protein